MIMNQKGRVAVFLSGRGSNFEAIYRASLAPDANYRIVVVISDKGKAPGLARAGDFGLKALHVAPKSFPEKSDYEKHLVDILKEERVELICLAGYMRIVGPDLLDAFPGRIMNIHPALLPSFPGLHAQKQAVEHGVKVSGCTVHFVDAGVDTGPVILQTCVAVRHDDDEESLAQRILAHEHRLYPRAVRLFFQNRLKITGRTVIIKEP
jgi:phosphoribosylglycinamide formyltransferase-1